MRKEEAQAGGQQQTWGERREGLNGDRRLGEDRRLVREWSGLGRLWESEVEEGQSTLAVVWCGGGGPGGGLKVVEECRGSLGRSAAGPGYL